MKESGDAVDSVLALLATDGIEESRLWFNGNIEILGQDGFSRLREAFPAAIVQCPIDDLTPGILDGDDEARNTLSTLRSWGVSRFSIEWDPDATPQVMDQLSRWGFQANIYNVPDLDSFLRAVLLQPRSITADFNFPEWHYYGRGSGQKGQYHEYSLEDESIPSPKSTSA